MTPEQTFLTELASGRLPALTILILMMLYTLHKGGIKIDGVTTELKAMAAALVTHKVDTDIRARTADAHVTAEASRVIAAIDDHRMSEIEGALQEVKRVASIPDSEHPMRRAGDAQRRKAAIG